VRVVSKALRVFMALLLAVPLGGGGLCCCLIGTAGGHSVASLPAAPCCPAESAPAQPPAGAKHENDCRCPTREAGLLAKDAPADGALLATVVAVGPAVSPTATAPSSSTLAGPAFSRVPHPPPKVPLHRTLCVILC
jgi:hypothetical protein